MPICLPFHGLLGSFDVLAGDCNRHTPRTIQTAATTGLGTSLRYGRRFMEVAEVLETGTYVRVLKENNK